MLSNEINGENPWFEKVIQETMEQSVKEVAQDNWYDAVNIILQFFT